MCKIEGCDAAAVGRELCAKHYMRVRRHGLDLVKRAGRKRNEAKAANRAIFPEWSDRTFNRYWLALTLMDEAAATPEQRRKLIADATRPNGSMNISKLLDEVWGVVWIAWDEANPANPA